MLELVFKLNSLLHFKLIIKNCKEKTAQFRLRTSDFEKSKILQML